MFSEFWSDLSIPTLDSPSRFFFGGLLPLTRGIDDDSGALVGFVEEVVGDGFGGGAGGVELAH